MKRLFTLTLLACLSLPLTQTHALDIALPEMGDSAGALISPREEYDIGQAFFWRLQQSTELIEDPEVNSYIQSLGYRLAANSDEPGLDYTFFMLPDPAVNAFAAPGLPVSFRLRFSVEATAIQAFQTRRNRIVLRHYSHLFQHCLTGTT